MQVLKARKQKIVHKQKKKKKEKKGGWGLALHTWGIRWVKPLVGWDSVHEFHTHSQDSGTVSETPSESAWSTPTTPALRFKSVAPAHGRSAAAELGQEIGDAEEDPHHQQVRAEGQKGQRVQEARVQPEVTHRQQAAQVLLDHPLPRPNAAESQEVGGRGGGVEQQIRLEEGKDKERKKKE